MMKPQATYLYDGSFEGMLTAVAVAVKSKKDVEGIFSEQHYARSLFAEVHAVKTDHSQAKRFFQYLRSLKGKASLLAIDGFLSENDEVAMHLYSMVCACLRHGADVVNWYTHDSVNFLDKLSRKVRREAHRFNGLVRFRILEKGMQYGPFEPDYNVIGYCGQHFRKRLSTIPWILHDVRRNQALYWDGRCCQSICIDESFSNYVRTTGEIPHEHLCQSEVHYQSLWNSFHEAIAIKERRNPALQRRCMPSRYWKFLPEIS